LLVAGWQSGYGYYLLKRAPSWLVKDKRGQKK